MPVNGGTVTIDPLRSIYPFGSNVTLTATAYPGLNFVGWTGDASGSSNPLNVTLNRSKTISPISVIQACLQPWRALRAIDFVSGGNATWYGIVGNAAHTGDSVARSGPIAYDPVTGYQSSWMQTMVEGSGVLRFWWKTSGPTSYMYFTVDGGYLNPTVGTTFLYPDTEWSLYVVNIIGDGPHVLQWTYYNYETDPAAGSGMVDTVAFGADNDQDGLPDNWEMQYFGGLSRNGSGDFDSDGNSDLLEFQDGTNPLNAASGFARLTIPVNGGTVTVNPPMPFYPFGSTVTLTATAYPGVSFVKWTGDATGNSNPLTVTLNRSKTISPDFGNPSLATALDGTGLVWTSGGDATWYGQTETSHDGVSAARSGPVGYDPVTGYQSSWLQTTINGPGRLQFWWKTAGPNSYLYLTVDGNYPIPTSGTNPISGDADWELYVVNIVGSGPHVLRWTYYNYDATAAGDGWLDMVTFQVAQAVSRKAHGSAGTFDIALPFTGFPGVECRSGGANDAHEIVISFPFPITFSYASVSSGEVSSTSGGGTNEVAVSLVDVSNAQTIELTLNSASDGANSGDIVIRMSLLLGDTTGNGSVNASDVSQTKARSGTSANLNNFRSDVTGNGVINASDITLVKSKSGSALP